MANKFDTLPENFNEKELLKELSALSPLDDRPFKLLASDDEHFQFMAESLSGESLSGEKIIHMNGEIVLTANGRLIRTDSLRKAAATFFNIESQVDAAKFPLKRHIYYTAVIYASGIQKGEPWEKLKPVISIVIYKDKGEVPLIENAALAGTLIKTDGEGKQLTLISVNTAKWKDAKTKDLQAYLATLHHGIMTDENKADFDGVDTDSAAFAKIQHSVKIVCAQTKEQELKSKGDDSMDSMAAILDHYISKEVKALAEARGEARGEARTMIKAAAFMLKKGIDIREIADTLNLSDEQIEQVEIKAGLKQEIA